MIDTRRKLENLLKEANTDKSVASATQGVVAARRWAIFVTEIEKVLAWYIAFLESKESE